MATSDVRLSSDGEEPENLHPASVPVASPVGARIEAHDIAAARSEDDEERLVAALLASSARVIWIALVDDRRDSGRAH
jgi:hypothetical protein